MTGVQTCALPIYPLQRVGAQVDQVSRLHLGLGPAAARTRSIEILDQLRIPRAAVVHGQYPHQLSGGMRQRIVIAMALYALLALHIWSGLYYGLRWL